MLAECKIESTTASCCTTSEEIVLKKRKQRFNPLPDMPILGSSNSAANKSIMAKVGMGIELSDRVENIEGKEEIARYEQFLLFPQCFPKQSAVRYVKTSIYGVKG